MAVNDLLGCPYPIFKTSRGYFPTQRGVDVIKSDLLQLFLTSPGERIMMPEFGCNLRQFLFEPNDEVLVESVREVVIEALERWEPRIAVLEINISNDTENQLLKIDILFRHPENIKVVEELSLELPVGGST
jgi:phage baseplate assembly protein W